MNNFDKNINKLKSEECCVVEYNSEEYFILIEDLPYYLDINNNECTPLNNTELINLLNGTPVEDGEESDWHNQVGITITQLINVEHEYTKHRD